MIGHLLLLWYPRHRAISRLYMSNGGLPSTIQWAITVPTPPEDIITQSISIYSFIIKENMLWQVTCTGNTIGPHPRCYEIIFNLRSSAQDPLTIRRECLGSVAQSLQHRVLHGGNSESEDINWCSNDSTHLCSRFSNNTLKWSQSSGSSSNRKSWLV